MSTASAILRGLRVSAIYAIAILPFLLCADASLQAPNLEVETESSSGGALEPVAASRRLEASEGEEKANPEEKLPEEVGVAKAPEKKKNSPSNGYVAMHRSDVMVKAVQHTGEVIGYFNAKKVEMYPSEIEHPWLSELSFVFDDLYHAYQWISSTPTRKSSDNLLKMSVAIREGAPDDRGYVSRAARIITSSEEIDSIAWLWGGLGEDSFLDSASEFDWTECPARGHLDDVDANMATLRDCAIMAMERGVIYDSEGAKIPQPTKAPRLPKIDDDEISGSQKLQDFLAKNRKRDGRLNVEMIVTDNDESSWTKTIFKFLIFSAMIPFGIWLYKKKKDMDLRSEKII